VINILDTINKSNNLEYIVRADIFIIAIIAILVYFMGVLYSSFLYPIIISILLCIATSGMFSYIEKKSKSKIVSAVVSALVLSIICFAPVVYLLFTIMEYTDTLDATFIQEFLNHIVSFAKDIIKQYPMLLELEEQITSKLNIAKISSTTIYIFGQITAYGASFLINSIIVITFYIFIFIYGHDILRYVQSIIPISKNNIDLMSKEITGTISMVFYSILLNSIFQGLLFGLYLYYFDYDGVLFGILYGVSSLVPIIGGAIMWIPVSLNEAANGNISNAIYISIYSVVVISIIADTFIKPLIIKFVNTKILKTKVHINELLIFFSIIAGLSSFGFWGMVIGPTITATFISVMRLYQKNFIAKGDTNETKQ
jgi:predicted PurR-regulated permease PerM